MKPENLLYGRRRIIGEGPAKDLDITREFFLTCFWGANQMRWELIGEVYRQRHNLSKDETFSKIVDAGLVSNDEIGQISHSKEIENIPGRFPPIVVKWGSRNLRRVIEIYHRGESQSGWDPHYVMTIGRVYLNRYNRVCGQANFEPLSNDWGNRKRKVYIEQAEVKREIDSHWTSLNEILVVSRNGLESRANELRAGTWQVNFRSN